MPSSPVTFALFSSPFSPSTQQKQQDDSNKQVEVGRIPSRRELTTSSRTPDLSRGTTETERDLDLEPDSRRAIFFNGERVRDLAALRM